MSKSRSTQTWRPHDVFTIKLPNGTTTIGKVICHEREALNSVLCAFYSTLLQAEDVPQESDCDEERLIALQFVSPASLEQGRWQVISHGTPFVHQPYIELATLRATGFVGVRVLTGAVIELFLNAYHGLAPWDSFADPLYMDRLLIDADRKPAQLIFKHACTD